MLMRIINKILIASFFLIFSSSVLSQTDNTPTTPNASTNQKNDRNFPTLHIVKHPLIQDKLTHLRNKDTDYATFRRLMNEVGMLLGYEVTKHLPTTLIEIETPLAKTNSPTINGNNIVIVPILRAGLGMSDGLHKLLPTAKVGHIGLYRDHETKKPVEYLIKLPKVDDSFFILVDPMLATGNSAIYGIDVLVRAGVPKSKIVFMSLLAAPEGVEAFAKAHPEIPIYTAALDDYLDENAYIVPGLGDAGDRTFGTL